MRATAAAILACAAVAQAAPLQGQLEPVAIASGSHGNPTPVEGVVWQGLVMAPRPAPWIRVYFQDVELGEGSYLRIASLRDGDVQRLDRKSLAQWDNSTAYFNGNSVLVELVAGPNTAKNLVNVGSILVGDQAADVPPQETICFTTDNRVPSTDPRAGRIVGIGCSGWIINTPVATNSNERLHLSAGHCFATGQVLQFNVPASSTTCSLVMPSANFQFAIDSAGSLSANTGIGNDYWVFRCFPNSNTGLTTFQAMGQAFNLATTMPAANTTLVNWGYGVDGTPVNDGATASSCSCASGSGARNQTQQTHTGPLTSVSGTRVNHQVDTCGGNSGSVIAINSTGVAIAIHTNAGCTSTGGSNSATAVTNAALQAAIASLASGTGPVAPANDNCANAIVLTAGTSAAYTTVGATAGSAFACAASASNDVWFRYDALATGAHTFATCSTTTNFDTVLELFSGACGSLVSVACNDDTCSTGSTITATLTAGQSYLLHVGGFSAAVGAFDVQVTAPAVARDECATATAITLGTSTVFNNTGATTSATPAWTCATGGNDLWFTFTANCTAPTTFSTCTAARTIDTVMSVYSGTCAALTLLGCNDDSCAFGSQVTANLVSGQTYYVRVGGFSNAVGNFQIVAQCGTGAGSMATTATRCGPANLTVTGSPSIFGTLNCSVTGATGLPFVGYGFNLTTTPFCGCTIGHNWEGSFFGGAVNLTIPCDPFFIGLQFGLQGLDLGGTGGCASPQLTVTDTVIVTIG
jgi:hypothetical protein